MSRVNPIRLTASMGTNDGYDSKHQRNEEEGRCDGAREAAAATATSSVGGVDHDGPNLLIESILHL